MKNSEQMEYDVRHSLLRSAFLTSVWLKESKADLMSRNATFSGWLNSRCSSDRSRRARMASVDDLRAVKPDCWGRRDWSIRGCMQNMSEYLAGQQQQSHWSVWLLQSVRGPLMAQTTSSTLRSTVTTFLSRTSPYHTSFSTFLLQPSQFILTRDRHWIMLACTESTS